MEQRIEEIIFTSEDGEEISFEILGQTRLAEVDYLLVTASEQEVDEVEVVDALILKDKSQKDQQEAIYEIVDNDYELELVAKVFKEIIGDVEIEIN